MRSTILLQALLFLLALNGCKFHGFSSGNKDITDRSVVQFQVIDDDEILRRTKLEFSLTKAELEKQLNLKLGKYSDADFKRWENLNWLESRMFDGEKRYFKRSVENVLLMLERERGELFSGLVTCNLTNVCLDNATKVMAASSEGSQKGFFPVKMVVTYKLVVNKDAVPAGETIRCWLPYPREDNPRQTQVKLLSVHPEHFTLAPNGSIHRTLYLEKVAVKDLPTEFSLSFSYQSDGFYRNVLIENVLPYDVDGELYVSYTRDEPPHISFSERVKHLSDSIVGKETDPRKKVYLIYKWIHRNIPWAGALEYSVMSNIPEYVLDNRRGDCGMQTFLFMSMARYQGVPVKWQSGWMMHPGEVNLHDWCEVYYNGIGWVPLDMSFGFLPADRLEIQEFYLSGMDSYRLIVNEGIAGELVPVKKYSRSEPYDFQRGEVEWKGGNLYFNRWIYSMKVEYQQ